MCIFEVFKTQNSGQRRKMADFYKKSLQTMKIGVICALFEWRGNVLHGNAQKTVCKNLFLGCEIPAGNVVRLEQNRYLCICKNSEKNEKDNIHHYPAADSQHECVCTRISL